MTAPAIGTRPDQLPTNGMLGTGAFERYSTLRRHTPASATAPGSTGDVCYDADYVYVCTASNTWKRAAIASW